MRPRIRAKENVKRVRGRSPYIRIYDVWNEARRDEKTRLRNAINKRDQETGGGERVYW